MRPGSRMLPPQFPGDPFFSTVSRSFTFTARPARVSACPPAPAAPAGQRDALAVSMAEPATSPSPCAALDYTTEQCFVYRDFVGWHPLLHTCAAWPSPQENSAPCVVGRGHAPRLANLDTRHSKRLRSIGHPRIYSPTKCLDMYRNSYHTEFWRQVEGGDGICELPLLGILGPGSLPRAWIDGLTTCMRVPYGAPRTQDSGSGMPSAGELLSLDSGCGDMEGATMAQLCAESCIGEMVRHGALEQF